MPEHDGAKSDRQRDQRRGHTRRPPTAWTRAGWPRCASESTSARPPPASAAARYGNAGTRCDAAQDVDQDRRGRAADAEHDDQATQRIELAGERTGQPDPRAEGEEQPGDQERTGSGRNGNPALSRGQAPAPSSAPAIRRIAVGGNRRAIGWAWNPASASCAIPQRRASVNYTVGFGASARTGPTLRVQYWDRMSKNGFTLRYLAQTAAGVPRDLANTLVRLEFKPIRPTVLIYNCTWVCDAQVRDVQQLEARRSQVGHDARAARAGDGPSVLGRGREPEHLRRRADHAQRSARDGRDVPAASAADAEDRDQHDRPHAASRDSDAHAHRRVLRQARPADQRPRLARRHRRHPRSGAPRQARLRQGLRDHRGDAGAVRSSTRTSSSASRRRSSRPTSTTRRTSWRGRARRSSTSCSTCCASPTRC